jgi:hypothetical protein
MVSNSIRYSFGIAEYVIFFLAVPLINALFFNQSNASQKDMK